jgi:hypothetical protein
VRPSGNDMVVFGSARSSVSLRVFQKWKWLHNNDLAQFVKMARTCHDAWQRKGAVES